MYNGISADWADLLAGSMSVIATATVLLDDDVIMDDLPITSGSITKSLDGQQIQQTLNLTTADDDGSLLAGPGAPLMPFGQQITIRAGLADNAYQPTYSELIPMGTFGIDAPDVESETPWRMYPNGAWFVTGGSVTVNGSDPLAQVAREPFTAPQRPDFEATVRSECRRILADRMPLSDWAGITDTAVSRQVVYDDSRLATLLDLAKMADGVAWVDRDGAFDLLKPGRKTTGVWELAVGDPTDPEDRGALVTWRPGLSREEFYNGVIVTSEDTIGNALRGVKYEKAGPLRWGGPFGEVPLIEENRLLKSNRACQAYAATRFKQLVAERSITVNVTCLPNLAVDPLDTISLRVPNRTILGLVTSVTYPLTSTVMEMEVSIPLADWIVL